MPDLDFPDLNVWLALVDADHEFHPRARHYWEVEASTQLAFCRVTMLGLLRLLTNPKVMRCVPFSVEEAWLAYRTFLNLPEVIFLDEPSGTEAQFAHWTASSAFAPRRWTDAWVAAHAYAAGARLVSFDSDFSSFVGLSFLQLSPP